MFRLTVPVVSPTVLARRGPLVDVMLMPDPDVGAKPGCPAAAAVTMLIDTGATSTLVDDRIPRQLGLVPMRTKNIIGVDGKVEARPVYPMLMKVKLTDPKGRSREAEFRANIVGMTPVAHALHGYGLIGRDFLADFCFEYDGHKGIFSLIDEHTPQDPAHAKEDEEVRQRIAADKRAERHRKKQARKARAKNR